MRMSSSQRRIRILPDNEIDDLFARPHFNDDERLIWFELNQDTLELLKSRDSLASTVDLIIQLGYFKARHQFFNFTLEDVNQDTGYVVNRFYPGEKLRSKRVSRTQRYRNQQDILQLMKMTLFNVSTHVPLLLEKSQSLSRVSNNPLFLFRGLFEYLKNNHITIPGYTTFQEKIISKALSQENARLFSGISSNMQPFERDLLLSLLEESEPFYAITCLKKHPKNFRLRAVRKEVENFERLLPMYQIADRILPLLNLSKTAIDYYASLVEHYTVRGLNRLNPDQSCLWLLCFVYRRYRLMMDNLSTMLIYLSSKYKEDVEEKAKELLVEDLLKPGDKNWKIAKALRFFNDIKVDDTQAFFHIKKKVHKFFPSEQIDQVVMSLGKEKDQREYRNQFHWFAVDALSATYTQPLRLLMKSLTLNGNQYIELQNAHIFLKNIVKESTPLSRVPFDQFPKNFISPSNKQFIYNETNKTIHTNRYEYDCYYHIALFINKSALYVTNSTRYSSLADELVPKWQDKKIAVIKDLNNNFLNLGINSFIETQVKPLDEQIKNLNEDIKNKRNPYVKIKKDKDEKEYWTLPYTRKNCDINNPFYKTLPNISVTNLLQVVHEHTGFLNEFTHIKPHYSKSKMDDMAISAALVANGTNLGVDRMYDLCDIAQSDLHNADKNYIRLATLRASNDRISNAIFQLDIFKHWNLIDDLLLASADGQKKRTERDVLLARFALKYFGLEKGVVSYSLIANHVPINCLLIGANMHESHFLFDLFYNNTSLIKPDILATDTEGANQLNFLFLHVIDKVFAPRYRSLSSKTDSIICFSDPKEFDGYLIKPMRAFNERLVRDEADNIQHIIASLLSGDANQSNIVRKLSSSAYASRTKEALWEMNAALMTEHLLSYIGDVSFRQGIQGGLGRGEAYHQLRRAIERANGRNFRGSSDLQMATWDECARLLTNCVIYYNSFILNELKRESDSRGDSARSQKIIRLSPAAWTHLNFQGRYTFLDNITHMDINNTAKSLLSINL